MFLDIPTDYGFTEAHALLRGEVRRLLEERCPPAEVRRWMEHPAGYDPALWKELGRLGWVGLVFDESLGGAGMDDLALAMLMDETGRHVLPAPLLGCLLAGFALERAGSRAQQERWLAPIAAGERIAALGAVEPAGAFEPGALATTAEPAEGGWVLRGRKTHVAAGPSAELLVVPAREPGGGIGLFVVELPAEGVTVEPEINVDLTRRTARIALDGVRVPGDARLEQGRADALSHVLLRGAMALAAELVGCAESALNLTRDYAIERKQFGRPIGSFQAVKHPLVDVMTGVELARSHAYGAGAAFTHAPEDAETAARMAKALAGDVATRATRYAVQLHGGYGFTWECDAHLYMRRTLWSRAMLGDAAHHRQRLAERLFPGETAPKGAEGPGE